MREKPRGVASRFLAITDWFISVPHFFFSTRFGMAVLAFFGFLAMNSQRVAMDLALPCMLNHTAVREQYAMNDDIAPYETLKLVSLKSTQILNDTSIGNSTPSNGSESDRGFIVEGESKGCGGAAVELDILKLSLNFTYSTKTGELVWPVTRQKVLSQTFYWGYVVAFLPCGWLSERMGGKFVLGVAIMCMSLTTSLISLSTSTHYFVLILLRFIAGLGAGACMPAMHAIWGKWAPPFERSCLAAISYSGHMVGRSFTFPLVGALCQYGFLGGWPSVFYVLGAFGFLWSILWMIFTKNFPSQQGRLDYRERRYLHATLMKETILEPRTDITAPCFAIITSLPFISVIISHFTYVWMLHAYETYIPVYFSDIHQYEYRENGFFNMIPYLGMMVFFILSGWWADQLRSRGVMGTAAVRKIMNTVGACVPAAMLIGLGFINCKQWIGAVCMLTIGMSSLGFQGSGFLINHLDLAPQYAGFLMGISGGLGSLAQFIQPYLVETITPEKTHEQWQTFFFISGCLGGAGGICFLLCGSGEVQPWARVPGYTSGTTSADYSTQSSMQSIDSLSKSNKKLNSTGILPTHYATLDDRKITNHELARSISDDGNKRYSTHSNVIGYDDPYYFRSLDRKESQKKLLASNPSYHSLEYPSRRITKSFDADTNRGMRGSKVRSLQEDAIMEILSNHSKDNLEDSDDGIEDNSGVEDMEIPSTPEMIIKRKPSSLKKKQSTVSMVEIQKPQKKISTVSNKELGKVIVEHNHVPATPSYPEKDKKKTRKTSSSSRTSVQEDPPSVTSLNQRTRKKSTIQRPNIQDDPPSGDKPSTSSADSKKSSRKPSRKTSKGSTSTIPHTKDLYDKMSESKV